MANVHAPINIVQTPIRLSVFIINSLPLPSLAAQRRYVWIYYQTYLLPIALYSCAYNESESTTVVGPPSIETPSAPLDAMRY